MSSTQPGNTEYLGQISNTDLSKSALSSALESQLPIRVVKGSVTVADLVLASDGVTTGSIASGQFLILKDSSGAYISLAPGEQVLSLNLFATTFSSAAGLATFHLSDTTPSSDGTGVISTGTPVAISTASDALDAAIVTPISSLGSVAASPNLYLALGATVEAISGPAVLQYSIVIVS